MNPTLFRGTLKDGSLTLGVQTPGLFRFYVNVEALTVPATTKAEGVG